MFTGIITDIGKLSEIKKSDKMTLSLGLIQNGQNFNIGSSICCNGVCLTVVTKKIDYFGVVK